MMRGMRHTLLALTLVLLTAPVALAQPGATPATATAVGIRARTLAALRGGMCLPGRGSSADTNRLTSARSSGNQRGWSLAEAPPVQVCQRGEATPAASGLDRRGPMSGAATGPDSTSPDASAARWSAELRS